MTLFAAMVMTIVSCSKDDDDNVDSQSNRLAFANKLTQNSTSCAWEGEDKIMNKNWGNWSTDDNRYAVMRFDRTSTTATEGTGLLLSFENAYKDKFKDRSEFMWGFANDELHITFRHEGWAPFYAEYRTQELVINGNSFHGTWFERSDRKFEFNYKKSSFNDWNKYTVNQ